MGLFDRFDIIVILSFALNIGLFMYSHYAVVTVHTLVATSNQLASAPAPVRAGVQAFDIGVLMLYGIIFGMLSSFYISIRNQNEIRKLFVIVIFFIMISYDLVIIFGGAAL